MSDPADRHLLPHLSALPEEASDDEIRLAIANENKRQRREDRKAAEAFARCCKDGRADLLHEAALWISEGLDAWRPAMVKVARLPCVSPEIQTAFLPIWVEHKMLPLHVGNRALLARALRVLLPGGYQGPPLILYRGAEERERRYHRYGFSWTTDPVIAHGFAQHWAQPGLSDHSGVVLRTVVPATAVLLVRQPEDYYDEGEVVIDPRHLGRVHVHERLEPPTEERPQ